MHVKEDLRLHRNQNRLQINKSSATITTLKFVFTYCIKYPTISTIAIGPHYLNFQLPYRAIEVANR